MKKFRVDMFIDNSHEIRYFSHENDARKAGAEAYRDGAKSVFLLKLLIDDKYEVLEQL